jgi:hypothetical protein
VATTWVDLVGYVRVRYEIFQQTEHTLRFHLPTTQGRTQRVAVHHVLDTVLGDTPGGPEGGQPAGGAEGSGDRGPGWILIESAVAAADQVDLRRLLELAGQSVIGGVVVNDGVALFRHAASLAELSLGGFDRPFQLVAARADELEHQLTGADQH